MKKKSKTLHFAFAIAMTVVSSFAQKIDSAKERKAVVKHYRFVGDHREESMWSALFGAKSG